MNDIAQSQPPRTPSGDDTGQKHHTARLAGHTDTGNAGRCGSPAVMSGGTGKRSLRRCRLCCEHQKAAAMSQDRSSGGIPGRGNSTGKVPAKHFNADACGLPWGQAGPGRRYGLTYSLKYVFLSPKSGM